MDTKQPTKTGREEHRKDNWKRKRETNNTNKNNSSPPWPSKKRRQIAHEPTQDSSPEISKAGSSTITSTVDQGSTSTSSSTDLTTSHDVTSINIISSTHIQKKVTQTLTLLSEYPSAGKPKIILLHAKAPVASKMVTIAEIAKREIAKSGGKWFQYNEIKEVLVEQKEVPKKDKGMNREGKPAGEEVNEDDEGDEETTAFEIMKTPFERAIEGKPKIRGVPVMTIYLSRSRIDGLRKAFGEQTNALKDSN